MKAFRPSGRDSKRSTFRPPRRTAGPIARCLFTTPGLSEFISGVILFDETIRQRTKAGVPMPEVLTKHGIIPGIKVDKGTIALANFAGEKSRRGLTACANGSPRIGNSERAFTKWRAVIAIGERLPTATCIEANARALALFAALSQEAGLVPIVEPEVLMDGNHTLARCEEVTSATLKTVFATLFDHRVVLEEMLLKTGHGAVGQRLSAAGRGRTSGRGHAPLPASCGAGRRSGDRVSFGRAK